MATGVTDSDLATLYGVDEQVLTTLRANEKAIYAKEIALFKIPTWRAHLMFLSLDEVRSMMKEKWTNMGLVSALMLTVNISYILQAEFEVADWAAHASEELHAAVRGIMFVASACCMCSVYGSIMLNDILSTFCPTESDLLFFMNRFDNSAEALWPPMLVNDPITFMTVGLVLTFVGFLIGYIASCPLYIGVPVSALAVAVLMYGCYFRCWKQLFGTAVPRCFELYGNLVPKSACFVQGNGQQGNVSTRPKELNTEL